ncbi:MAG: diguanylate cyclase [Dactylosporangium sp.]|nr:diguanylate cyclase [Dactylosporangium sp.]
MLYSLVSASATGAILIGLRRCPSPRPWLPWLLLALGQAVYAIADVIFYTAHYLFDSARFPSVADVFYLGRYPLVCVALALLIRRRTPGRDLAGLLDAGTLAVIAALLSWLFLIGPQARAQLTILVKVTTLAHPVMDLAIFAVALRLVLGQGRQSMSFFLLNVHLFAIFAADTLHGLQLLDGSYTTGNYLDAIWLAGNLALGAAALHPTVCCLDQPPRREEVQFGPVRMLALTAAGLVGPAVLLADYHRRSFGDTVATATAWAVLFLLTVLKMHRLIAEQRRLAVTDELTGLYTRRYFQSRLASEVARARRSGGDVAVLMIDVDHFKAINDRYGHPAGDRALVGIADRLRSATGAEGLLARHGGEEFALLLASAPVADLLAVCERLRCRVANRPITIAEGISVTVTVSIGAAMHPHHAGDSGELVTIADQALYRAKACGRDRSVIGRVAEAPVPHRVDGARPPGTELATALVPRRLRGAANPAPMVDFLRFAADQVDVGLSTREHSLAVARWARLLATEMGYDDDTAVQAELAGRLHDVGKIVIPPAILGKRHGLSDDEWGLLRQHPDQGAQLVGLIPGFERVAEIVRQHHERYDGTGYPARLAGTRILPEARILAVCDSWAAMRSDRPYRSALDEPAAVGELRRGRGVQYDPRVVDAFLDLHQRGRLPVNVRQRAPEFQLVVLQPPAGADGTVVEGIPGG